jgi:hypothetical protein
MMMNGEIGMVTGETENPAECWSAGVMGGWSSLAIHPSSKSIKPRPNRAQSSPIKPNQGISCLDAIQSQPPSRSKTWKMKPQRTQSRFRIGTLCSLRSLRLNPKSEIQNCPTTPCGAPSATPLEFHLIPLNSTWFHLIPLPASCCHLRAVD